MAFRKITTDKKIQIFIVAAALFFLAVPAFAQELINPLGRGVTDLRVIAGRIIQAVLGLSGTAALVMVIYGAGQWILSRGDKTKVQEGINTLKWSVIGLLIMFTAYTLVDQLIRVLTSVGTTPTTP